jgi:hypothetical protein
MLGVLNHKIDTFLVKRSSMFSIGRPPKAPKNKYARPPSKGKYIPYNTEDDINNSKATFTMKPTEWLLLPKTNLHYFERNVYNTESTASFTEMYSQSISFTEVYPEDSIGYRFAKGAFPTALSYTTMEEHIRSTFIKNNRLRICMKRLVNAWKRRHMKIVNDIDLVTQEIPKKPVYLLDWATKTTYQFEASTILRDSINRLMNHDVMILEPLMPRNPFTNSDLTYGGCLSLHKQLRNAGVTHWIWEAYASSNFNLLKLLRNFEVPMKYYCLDLVLKDPTDFNTLEFIMDFMLGEYTHHSIENPPRDILIFSMITLHWNTNIIRSWVDLCKVFWRAQIKNIEEEEIYVHIKSRELIRKFKLLNIIG